MIRILTDSTADFSMADAAAMGVAMVPLTVSFGDAHYQNGIDLPLERFYDMLAAADKLPTTSQPSPELFLSHFLAAKAAGDTVICVLLSAALSGTCQSAEIAKEEAEYDNIYIVDSRSATLGLQLLVRRAVQRVAEGFSAMDIVADLETARTHLRLYAVVDTLKYLHKGGRLSGAVAIAGGLLGIKPVLSLDARGKLDMVDKDLLRRAVLERPAAQECVLTAHKAPQWMLDAADYSTEMKCCRHPYQKGIKARKGIEY